MTPLPTFIIAGALRCGTTSLNAYLRAHPAVVMSSKKEVHFFDQHYARGLEWYRQHFPGDDQADAVGEATPNYLFDPAAMRRIHHDLPHVRIVVMLRDPVDRAYSQYWHDRSRGKIDHSFSEAVAAELSGRSEAAYVARGFYKKQLDHAFTLFPRDAVHVATLEELTEQPEAVYAAVCRFIGVSDTFHPPELGAPVNAYAEFRSLRLRNLSKRLPKRLGNAVGRLNRKEKAYASMDPDARRRLVAIYAEANAGLDELVGRPLPSWSRTT